MTRNRNQCFNVNTNQNRSKENNNYPYRRPTTNFNCLRQANALKEIENTVNSQSPTENNQTTPTDTQSNTNETMPTTTKRKTISILHWNANGIWGKKTEFKELIEAQNPDIISINEIKFGDEITANHFLNLPGYLPYTKTRIKGKGGGVALLIKVGIRFDPNVIKLEWKNEQNKAESLEHLEAIGLPIYFGNKIVNVFTYYNPPENKIDERLFKLAEQLGEFLIIGDLNAHIPPYERTTNQRGKELVSILGESMGTVLNDQNKPTYIHNREGQIYGSTLDLGIGSPFLSRNIINMEIIKNSEISKYQKLAYHEVLKFEIKTVEYNIIKRIQNNPSFIYNNANWEEFNDELNRQFIDDDIENETIEAQCISVGKKIKTAAETAIPMTQQHKRTKKKYPHYVNELINYKRQCQKKYLKNQNELNANDLKEAQIMVGDAMDKFSREQWEEFLAKIGPHPLSTTPFWRRINRIRGKGKGRNIGTLKVNGLEVTENGLKAQAFATRLKEVFSNDDSSQFNRATFTRVTNYANNKEYEREYSEEEKQTVYFSMNELSIAIKNLNRKTSTDQDGISNRILRHLNDLAKQRVLNLFNKCLETKQIPNHWKCSQISMLHKPNTSTDQLTSYRPISITPCLARLFEKIMLMRISRHLKQKKILIMQQSGFRKNRQTRDNILLLLQKAKQSFGQGRQMVAVFFDITAAFDKVWHDGLMYKLAKIKLPFYLLIMIREFITNRFFIVKIENSYSSKEAITAGVPQGAVLSPTLFSIFINDAPIRDNGLISSKSNEFTALFADDIAYLCSFSDKNEAEQLTQSYLNDLENWANGWRLKLAPHKCSQVIFTRNKRTGKKGEKNNHGLNIKIYGVQVPIDDSPKFLGIKFDKRLTYKEQINHIKDKVSDRISILKILSYDKHMRVDEKILVNVYKILVRSVIDYSSLLINDMSKTHVKELETIQNNSLRAIFKIKMTDHVEIATLLERAKVSTIKERLTSLANKYLDKAVLNENELVNKIIDDYCAFKNRYHLNPAVADSEEMLRQINEFNHEKDNTCEKIKTILCGFEATSSLLSDQMPWSE
jgi:hypothetical protein